MRKFLKKLLDSPISPRYLSPGSLNPSRYRAARAFRRARLWLLHGLRDGMLIVLGIAAAGLGLEGFLLPNNFIDGGVTGISLLVAAVTPWSLPLLLVIINLPFIAVAYRQIGRGFAIKSALGIVGLSLALWLVHFPRVTDDPLLIATFGGFFLGVGIGFAVRGGAVLDGTEVLAIFLSRKMGLTIGDILLIFNVIIFAVAAYLLSIETALYAILTYLAASKTVDFVVEGVEEYIGVTIVSSRHEEIRTFIVEQMGRGVTVYSGLRGHGKRGALTQTEIIFTVITRLEIARLQSAVRQIDPAAFVAMHSVRDTSGGIIKKRAWKEH